MLAVCYFSNTSENIFGGGGTFGGAIGIYNHISNPLFLTHGVHNYYFRCFIFRSVINYYYIINDNIIPKLKVKNNKKAGAKIYFIE